MPFYPVLEGGSPTPTKIDYQKKVGTRILASLLEDPENTALGSVRMARR